MARSDEEIAGAVREWFDAFNREDFDAAIQRVHPDVEFIRPGGLPPLYGAEAMRAWMEPDAFESQVVELRDITVNGDRVLVRQRTRVRGAGSGIEVELESWLVLTLDMEREVARRLEAFQLDDEAAARRAAGL